MVIILQSLVQRQIDFQEQTMPRFAAGNSVKTFIDNSHYRGDYRRIATRFKISTTTILVESNQSPDMVNIVNTGPSSW